MDHFTQAQHRLTSQTPIGSGTMANHHSTPQPTQQDAQLVNWLLTELTLIFTKWREVWTPEGMDGVRRVWLTTLVEQGVTNKGLIEHGLRACRACGWVRPIPPGQFCEWAHEGMKKASGIPSADEAREIIRKKLMNPNMKLTGAMFHMGRQLDWHMLRSSPFEKCLTMIDRAYEATVTHWQSGKSFDQPIYNSDRALPVKPTERGRARQNMGAILAQLN